MSNSNMSSYNISSYFNNISSYFNNISLPLCETRDNKGFVGRTSSVINMIVNPLLLVSGIIGNMAGLWVLSLIRKRSRTTNHLYYYYLQWIAWLNLITCIFYFCRVGGDLRKFIASNQYTTRISWITFNSYYSLIFINGFFGASILILCLLLWDRFMSLHSPFTHIETVSSQSPNSHYKLLKNLPYFFTIFSNVLCFSSYYWYNVLFCYGTMNQTNYNKKVDNHLYYNRSYNLRKWIKLYYSKRVFSNSWVEKYDWMRILLISVLPGFFILYYGFGITFYIFKFLRAREIRGSNLGNSQLINITFNRNANPTENSSKSEVIANKSHTRAFDNNNKLFLIDRASLRNSIFRRRNTIKPEEIENGEKGSNQLHLNVNTLMVNKTNSKILARNLSALIYFILYCVCEVPNIMVVTMKGNPKIDRLLDISNMLEMVFFTSIFYIYMSFDKNFQCQIVKIYNNLMAGKLINISNRETMINF
ncbi:unnamed protein product [Gordionus sp. m RMFG-2023]